MNVKGPVSEFMLTPNEVARALRVALALPVPDRVGLLEAVPVNDA